MISYIEYIDLPSKVGISIICLFVVIQVVGEILEFKGKVVPEFVKIRKYFSRKRRERQMAEDVFSSINDMKKYMEEISKHYSPERIKYRDEWIDSVNKRLAQSDAMTQELNKKLDRNNRDTLSLLVDSKRNALINFASRVVDEDAPATREQFNRAFKLYDEYEKLITENGLTNGEVDIAHRIIEDSYEAHMRNNSFIEDVKGYYTKS